MGSRRTHCRRNTKEVPLLPPRKTQNETKTNRKQQDPQLGSIIRFLKNYSKESIFIELLLPKS
jgi:hypothetical protein